MSSKQSQEDEEFFAKVSEANQRKANQHSDNEWDAHQAKMQKPESFEPLSDKVQQLEELVRIKRLQDELDGVPNAQNAAAAENGVIIGFLVAILIVLGLLLQ